jgi:peroxiredoxin Q/BCP
LLSDPDHQIAEAYGAWGEKKMYGKSFMGVIRSSFLIDEKGKIIQAWYKVKPLDTVPKTLEALESS